MEQESQPAKTMQRIWRDMAMPTALATEAQAGIQKAAVEPKRQRTKVELEAERSPMEPEDEGTR